MEISYWENEFGKKIYRVASTVNQPKAAIGFVHGLGEHIHRYEELFAFYISTIFHAMASILQVLADQKVKEQM